MGLDNFTSEGSSLSDSSLIDESKSESEDESRSKGPKTTVFKTIGSGTSSLRFQTEEEWEAFVEFVENGLGFDIDRVLSWTEEKQLDFFGHAHSFHNDELFIDEHTVTQECIVCDREFVFPRDWDFILFNHKAVCPSHSIGEAAEAYDQLDDT